MTELRSDVFIRAVETVIGAGPGDPGALFTDDVHVWSPALRASSLTELTDALEDRDEALSNVTVLISSLNSGGNVVIAEWRLDADHTGPLVLDEDLVVQPTGRHIHIGGATFAEFRGDKIQALRSYFDDLAVTEQLIGAG